MSRKNSKQPLTSWRLCRWSCVYAWHQWAFLLAIVIGNLLGMGLNLLKPWPMVILVDYALRGKRIPPHLAGWVTALTGAATPPNLISLAVGSTAVIFLLGWLVGLVNGYATLCLRQRMNYDLAGDVFSKLQQLSLHFHARAAVAENMRRITSDSTCASTIVLNAMLPACSSALSLVAMLVILWHLDRALALISLVVVPYMTIVVNRFSTPLKKETAEIDRLGGRLYRFVEQSFFSIAAVQAFCREGLHVQRFARISREILDTTLSRNRMNFQFSALLGLATAAGTAAVLWIGGQKALAGTMSVGAIIAFLSYLGSLYGPLEGLLRTGTTIHDATIRAKHVWEILDDERSIKEKRGAKELKISQGHVKFENITFGYEANCPVLRNITFEALPGQTVALVGATGAGKTTLVSLLPRFFDPWEGAVLIDGQDVRDLQLKSLRNSIAFVLQEPFLFPISIAENIAYGNPSAGFDQIEAAARAAKAHDFISKLPAGYNTIVGERGATFSGGERQRISIARALLKRAPFLILDEPTSALDAETEQGLLQALRLLTQGRTGFIVAHRFSTIRYADSILVLKDGQIAESGTHDQLVTSRGIYAHLYELQSEKKLKPVNAALGR